MFIYYCYRICILNYGQVTLMENLRDITLMILEKYMTQVGQVK